MSNLHLTKLRRIIKEEVNKEVLEELRMQYYSVNRKTFDLTLPGAFRVTSKWTGDVEADEPEISGKGISRHQYNDALSDIFDTLEQQILDFSVEHSKQIKSFVEKCDMYARKFGMDEQEFFELVSGQK